jgi:hypothetical protein
MGVRWMPLGGVVAAVVALNLLGGSAMAAAPAKAPKPQDVKAARAVVRDFTDFDQTAIRREGAMTAAAQALVAQVKAGCAGAIPASIQNGTKKQQGVYVDVVLEAAFDLSLRTIHPVRHAALTLSNRIDRIHFSARRFTRGLHGTANAQKALVGITPSDLCTDVKAAAAGGFDADAPGTTAFLKVLNGVGSGPGVSLADIVKRVRPLLLTKPDRAALARLKKVDAQYSNFSLTLGLKWGAKLATVLVAAPPAGGTGGFPTNPPPPPPAASSARAAMTAAFATL